MSDLAIDSVDWFSNDAATFGDRVAWAREALGLTQPDLSRKLGVKLKTLEGWEADTSEPRANKLQMLSGLLNVSISWLLTGEGEGPNPHDIDAPFDRDLEHVLAEMRALRTRLLQDAERIAVLEKAVRERVRDLTEAVDA
jgi:transcriptional regulator with XRE-family HTH domain